MHTVLGIVHLTLLNKFSLIMFKFLLLIYIYMLNENAPLCKISERVVKELCTLNLECQNTINNSFNAKGFLKFS